MAALWDKVSAAATLIDLPSIQMMNDIHRVIVRAEMAATVADHDAMSSSADDAARIRRQVSVGMDLSAVEALSMRDRLIDEFESALRGYDALMIPTIECVAPRFRM